MKKQNYVIVAGTFDLFHVGHIEILRRASKYGKVLAVVNSDRFVKEFKGITPTIDEESRADVVESCKYVHSVYYNDSKDLKNVIDKIVSIYGYNITGVVFGDDYDLDKYRKQTQITREWQQQHDIALIQLPRADYISSTDIRRRIK